MMGTKERLVQSALKLFTIEGFENTSTAKICRDAGVASGTLFVHFNTKNELLDAIYRDIKKELASMALTGIDSTQGTEEKIKIIFNNFLHYFSENYEKFHFLRYFSNSPHISRLSKESVKNDYIELSSIIQVGKNTQHIKNIPNPVIFDIMMGIVESSLKNRALPYVESIDFSDIFWNAIKI